MPRPSNKLMFLRFILRMFVTMKVGNHEGAAIVFPGQRHMKTIRFSYYVCLFLMHDSVLLSQILSYLQNTTGYTDIGVNYLLFVSFTVLTYIVALTILVICSKNSPYSNTLRPTKQLQFKPPDDALQHDTELLKS